jgi:hypothetical protein
MTLAHHIVNEFFFIEAIGEQQGGVAWIFLCGGFQPDLSERGCLKLIRPS